MIIRSILAAAVFWVLLTATDNRRPGSNAVVVVIMFLFLLLFGWAFDKWFYRWRLRRWERRRAGG